MERIGLIRDPRRDFDHPNVDTASYPELVRTFYFMTADHWLVRYPAAYGERCSRRSRRAGGAFEVDDVGRMVLKSSR
jgi:hypothetical protein